MMTKRHTLASVLLVLLAATICIPATEYTVAQKSVYHVKPDEQLVFGFMTKHDKALGIALGKNNSYLVYRYGKKGRVELEYPAKKDKSSFGKFTYSSYYRGGSKSNLGLDLQRLSFRNHNTDYEVFYEYSAEYDTEYVGVRVNGDEVISDKSTSAKCVGTLSDVFEFIERD
jgi:hypothetical protein